MLAGVVPAGVVAALPAFDEPGVFPAGVVAGGPGVLPAGLVEGGWPGVFPAGVVSGGPAGVVPGVPVSEVDVLPEAELDVDPGLGTAAQNAWTVSPFAVAAAVNREKATDDRAFPRVELADACESGAKYAVHRPNSFAVAVGAANAVLRP